jgi:hypothetical protein
VRRVLEKLDFFGADELVRKIIDANVRFRSAVKESASQPASGKSGIRKAAVALSFLLNALVVSDSGLTALENDFSRSQALIGFISEEIRVEPLMLSPPAEIGPTDAEN